MDITESLNCENNNEMPTILLIMGNHLLNHKFYRCHKFFCQPFLCNFK